MFRYCCLFAIMLLMCGASYGYSWASADPYPDIEIPIYEGAFNHYLYLDKNDGIKSLTYRTNIEYPANGVVKYYEESLNNMGFLQGDIDEPQWQSFVDGTVKGSPRLRRLFFKRQNKEIQIEALVVLSYKNYGEGWSDELIVTFQLQPIYDTSKLDIFMEELESTDRNAYVLLLELLESYRGEDGEEDLNKAVRDNQENVYLLKYKYIIDEFLQEIGGNEECGSDQDKSL